VSALTQILQYLKKHGPRLDAEIAKATGMPLETVRQRVAKLRATGDVITCDLTRFEEGKPIQAWICRVSGYTPPAAPGRKPKRAAVVSHA
jgi:predicted ArsR family transcriptional regulator